MPQDFTDNKTTDKNLEKNVNPSNGNDPEPLPENNLPEENDLTQETTDEPSFAEKWKNHRFLFLRATYTIFNSVWIVIMAVGGFIAWLIAMIAL